VLLWQARPYLDDVVATVRDRTDAREPSFADYPELISKAHRQYFVNDFVQYDGRDPELKRSYDRLFRSRQLAAIVSGTEEAPRGYRRLSIRRSLPPGIYPTYVYVRRPAANLLR